MLQIYLLLQPLTGNRLITKLTTLLLILVFSQKMGMGLYLHNWLHAPKQHTTASKPITGQEIQVACGCIDNFNLPLTETTIPEIQVPVKEVHQLHQTPVFTLPVIYKYFRSLRAPPAYTA